MKSIKVWTWFKYAYFVLIHCLTLVLIVFVYVYLTSSQFYQIESIRKQYSLFHQALYLKMCYIITFLFTNNSILKQFRRIRQQSAQNRWRSFVEDRASGRRHVHLHQACRRRSCDLSSEQGSVSYPSIFSLNRTLVIDIDHRNVEQSIGLFSEQTRISKSGFDLNLLFCLAGLP